MSAIGQKKGGKWVGRKQVGDVKDENRWKKGPITPRLVSGRLPLGDVLVWDEGVVTSV